MAAEDEFNFLSNQKEFFGVLKGGFLARSIGSINPHKPFCVDGNATVGEVLRLIQQHRIGSILVVAADGTLSGIFTERDYLLKCAGAEAAMLPKKISELMTPNPTAQPPETAMAFIISLMVDGGFRHVPIVDEANKPIGIVSVKDIMHAIGQQFMADIESLETA